MKKIITGITTILILLILAVPVYADYPTITIPTPIGGLKGSLGEWINTGINWAVAIGAIVTIAYIVWGGFDYVMAGDDAKKVEAARAKITNGVIGLIIIASAWAIFRMLVSVLNLERIFPGSSPGPTPPGPPGYTP